MFIVEPKDLKPFVEALDTVGLQDCGIVERLVSFVASRQIRVIDTQMGIVLLETQQVGAVPSTVVRKLHQMKLHRPEDARRYHVASSPTDGVDAGQLPESVEFPIVRHLKVAGAEGEKAEKREGEKYAFHCCLLLHFVYSIYSDYSNYINYRYYYLIIYIIVHWVPRLLPSNSPWS